MKPKMHSVIKKIVLINATFTNEPIEPTFVNFFYGKNGAGKSTIRYNLASSMFSYMNDSPAVISDGFNYIDDGSDAEMCRKVFKLIFKTMG